MNILIIEDEEVAANRLRKMLLQLDSSIESITEMASVATTVAYLKSSPSPDLIFADIHLGDGASFEIFKQVAVNAPVIFTTAYDQYAIKAFKHNGIDYLLKPIKGAELEQSLSKFKKLKRTEVSNSINIRGLIESINSKEKFQKRLLIKYGQSIRAVEIAEVAYFYTEGKISFACTRKNNRWPVDHNLDELEKIIDPSVFFRINRQFIINVNAIESMHSYSKSRVKILLNPPSATETIVSAERSSSFKDWLQGK